MLTDIHVKINKLTQKITNMSIIGMAAVQGASNIASGVIGNLFQKRNLGMQTQQNKELADYQYSKDLEMWHLQNLYNSPKAQMQRFAEAGLNPNLMYGKGTSGNATVMPKASQVTAGRHNTKMPNTDAITAYQNIRQMDANTKNTMANTQMTEQAITNKMTEDSIKNLDLQLKRLEMHWYKHPSISESGTHLKSNRFNQMQLKYRQQERAYQMSATRDQLIHLQARNAYQSLLMQQKQYRWYNWQQGVNLGSKALGNITGLAGVSKIGKLRAPKPKFSKYTRNQYRQNQDISPNLNF